MPRYYDIDKLAEMAQAKADTLIEGKEAFLYVAKWLELLPAADVVPKSELEKLQVECLALKQKRLTLFDRLDFVRDARLKAAMDIFAEIEEDCLDFPMKVTDIHLIVDKERYDELKKKYTEGETDEKQQTCQG